MLGLSITACFTAALALLASPSADAANVAITQRGPRVAVAVGRGGITTRELARSRSGRTTRQVVTPLPSGINSFIDVALDDANSQRLVFALSNQGRVCSFEMRRAGPFVSRTFPLRLINCAGNDVAIAPFSGISATGGTLIVSGGTGGMTVFSYNTGTGRIAASPRFQNERLPSVIGHPDVVLLSPNTAALSTDFSNGPSRFGTLVANLSGNQPMFQQFFPVQNSLGFSLTGGTGNFPLVNCVYRPSGQSSIFMYTANGALTVQDPSDASSTRVIDDNSNGLDAVSCSVNQDLRLLVVISPNRLHMYSLRGNPMRPRRIQFSSDPSAQPPVLQMLPMALQGRATSVASSGSVIAYTNSNGDLNTLEINPSRIDRFIRRQNRRRRRNRLRRDGN